MLHLVPVGWGEGAGEGASDEEVTGEGDAIFAASIAATEADAIWYAMAANSAPRASSFTAVDVGIGIPVVTATPAGCIVWVVASCAAIWAISPPRAANPAAIPDESPGLAAALVKPACEEAASSLVTWATILPRLPMPVAAASDGTTLADEEVRTVAGKEDITANEEEEEEELAVALALPITTAKPDGPDPIPLADERMSPRNAMKA